MPAEIESAVAQLTEERDFLLARCTSAGRASFSNERWTGMSSNALVALAFGGKDDCLPHDGQDLAACYRTVMRLPKHLLNDAVFSQLERGEQYVEQSYPSNLEWAREVTEWPGIDALKASAHGT